jgi:hypothetical protein
MPVAEIDDQQAAIIRRDCRGILTISAGGGARPGNESDNEIEAMPLVVLDLTGETPTLLR